MSPGQQRWLGIALIVVGLIAAATLAKVAGRLAGVPVLLVISGLIMLAFSKRR